MITDTIVAKLFKIWTRKKIRHAINRWFALNLGKLVLKIINSAWL